LIHQELHRPCLQAGNFQHLLHIIFRIYFVSSYNATAKALMDQHVFSFFHLNPNRLHHPLTCGGAVTWIIVHMLAVKTYGAVIGIAVPFYKRSAVFACKIFYGFDEFGGHVSHCTRKIMQIHLCFETLKMA